jgi:hypothetical protein
MFEIQALPASDFKDLIILLQQHEESFRNLLNILRTSCSNDVTNVDQIAIDIDLLRRQIPDIDTSYGWVLASDSALFVRMCDVNDQGDAKKWLRKLFEKYEDRKEALSRLAKNLK